MADGTGSAPPPGHGPDAGWIGTGAGALPGGAAERAADWVTIWQSEMAAMALDRETQEGFIRLVDVWADAARTASRLLPGAVDGAPGRASTAAAAGSEAGMASPDARDATLRRLAERVDELERQLAALGGGKPGPE